MFRGVKCSVYSRFCPLDFGHCMGRVIRYIDSVLWHGREPVDAIPNELMSHWLYRVITREDVVHFN